MNITLRTLVAQLAAVVGGSLFVVGVGSTAVAADDDRVAQKREDSSSEVATVDDDDDDATGTNSGTGNTGNTGTGNTGTENGTSADGTGQSRSKADGTNSRHTAVSPGPGPLAWRPHQGLHP